MPMETSDKCLVRSATKVATRSNEESGLEMYNSAYLVHILALELYDVSTTVTTYTWLLVLSFAIYIFGDGQHHFIHIIETERQIQ